MTASASPRVMRGRRETRFIISSSKTPMLIGMRRTWNAFAPISASAIVLLDVRVHPLDDRDDGDEEGDATR